MFFMPRPPLQMCFEIKLDQLIKLVWPMHLKIMCTAVFIIVMCSFFVVGIANKMFLKFVPLV